MRARSAFVYVFGEVGGVAVQAPRGLRVLAIVDVGGDVSRAADSSRAARIPLLAEPD